MSKVPLDKLLNDLEKTIRHKWESGNEQRPLDDEVLAMISVYRHGGHDYKKTAKKWLMKFLVNAGYVKGIRSIGG